MERDGRGAARRALGRLLEAVLASRGEANAVFDILAVLQVGAPRGGRRDGVAGSGSVGPGLGRGQTLARRGSGLYRESSLVSQGSRVGGSRRVGVREVWWGWDPRGESG